MRGIPFFYIVATLTSSAFLTFLIPAIARDPDILTDFVVPPGLNATEIDGAFFTYTGMRSMPRLDPSLASFTVTAARFPALDGQGVSASITLVTPTSPTKPHIHRRASELLLLIDGSLEVGFIDSKGMLYERSLQAGGAFVFPQGLVHYMICPGDDVAVAISAFGSANPGTMSIPETVFGHEVDERVLSRSFQMDVRLVRRLKARLAPRKYIADAASWQI